MTFPLMKKVNALCRPAYLYLAVSVLVILILIIQNIINGDKKELCVGTFSCNVTNVVIILTLKILYVLFWTVVLDALCKYGFKSLSWVLVVLPYVVFAVAFVLLK